MGQLSAPCVQSEDSFWSSNKCVCNFSAPSNAAPHDGVVEPTYTASDEVPVERIPLEPDPKLAGPLLSDVNASPKTSPRESSKQPIAALEALSKLFSPVRQTTPPPAPRKQVDTMGSTLLQHLPESLETPCGAGTLAYRIRFFNFNMANSGHFSSLDDLHVHGNQKYVDALSEPFPDSLPVDIMFTTLVETRLNVSEWVQEYLDMGRGDLNSIITQNARREGSHNTRSRMRSFAERIGASYNGNLKSLLAFNTQRFKEDQAAVLFGRLTEAKIAGVAVPNPKKAFMGKALRCVSVGGTQGIRLCFVSAHFPMARLAAILENPTTSDTIASCKIEFAMTLRRILRKASDRGLIDERTLLIVQGDLNSRTVLHNGEAKDVLLELLNDSDIQAALIHELPVPWGQWREPVAHNGIEQLPVTYKFQEEMGATTHDLTLGIVLKRGYADSNNRNGQGHDNELVSPSISPKVARDVFQKDARSPVKKDTKSIIPAVYRRTLINVGAETLDRWGVAFKKQEFRPYRFPAAADRIIYWAPECLEARISWIFPNGGYKVNYSQLGSDHRPVAVDALLRVVPGRSAEETLERQSRHTQVFSASLKNNAKLRVTFQAISKEDDLDDSDDEHDLKAHPSSASSAASADMAHDRSSASDDLAHAVSRSCSSESPVTFLSKKASAEPLQSNADSAANHHNRQEHRSQASGVMAPRNK